MNTRRRPLNQDGDILALSIERRDTVQSKARSTSKMSSLNDLEFAYAPVRNQVRDLREYL